MLWRGRSGSTAYASCDCTCEQAGGPCTRGLCPCSLGRAHATPAPLFWCISLGRDHQAPSAGRSGSSGLLAVSGPAGASWTQPGTAGPVAAPRWPELQHSSAFGRRQRVPASRTCSSTGHPRRPQDLLETSTSSLVLPSLQRTPAALLCLLLLPGPAVSHPSRRALWEGCRGALPPQPCHHSCATAVGQGLSPRAGAGFVVRFSLHIQMAAGTWVQRRPDKSEGCARQCPSCPSGLERARAAVQVLGRGCFAPARSSQRSTSSLRLSWSRGISSS